MRKKILSLCMALVLCLSLLPATARAITPRIAYDILWIGNTRITDSGYWTTDGNGNLMASDAGNYNIAFDADTNTLTLNNANIAGQYNFTYNNVDAGIYAYSRSGAVSLTIQVTGNNVVSGSSGIYALSNGGEVSVTISGGGSLTASGSWNGISIVSEFSSAALAIEGTALKASGSFGDGVQVQAGESSSGSLSVNGGSLTASGNTGIYFYFSTGDSGSGIPSLTVAGNAVVDAKGGGIAHNSSNNLSIQGNSGIVFNGSTGTVYGNASLQEDLIIGEGESLTLDNGASLDANGHNVIVDGGTLDEGIKNSLGNSVKYTPTITTTSLPNGTAEAAYSTTLLADGTAPITWSVTSGSLPEGLSLDASTGMISGTPTAEGGSTFTVTAANAYGSDSREFTLSIDKPVVIPVTGVKLDKTSLTLQETGSDTLTVTVEPDNATSKNVNWESSDTSIATVDASGKVTAISAGSVTITVAAADGSGVSASCSVTVTHGNMVHTPKKDATCTADGNKEYWTCGTCGKIFSDAEGKTEIELSATVIPATGHNLTKTEENAPTCTAEGNTEYWTCGTCRKHFSDEEGKTEIELSSTVIPAVGHSFSGGTCTVCGAPDPNYTPPYIPLTYAVTVPETTGGTVEVSPSRASSGRRVTITTQPAPGYELESLTVLDSRGSEIALTAQGDGKYTFTMPSRKVTVEASFAEIAPEPLPFGDVDDGDWFADAVRFVYENGMMNGVSETDFAPHAATSRSMIVTILYRLEGEPVVDYAMGFTDVAGDAYYAEAVRWAASEGIVGGYGGGLFGSDDAVTREQLAVILYRYAVYKGYDVSIGEDTNILSYADAFTVSEYAVAALQWACGAGIISGTGDGSTLTPQGEATRAQAAMVLMRFCNMYGNP